MSEDPADVQRREKAAACEQRVSAAAIKLKAWERIFLVTKIEEHMGSLSTWPTHIAEMLLSRHLRFNDRFQLTLFMLVNKCMPAVYAEWLIKRGMLKDKSAREHVAGIIEAHKTGKLEAEGKTAYVMDATLPNGDVAPNDMKVCTVATPHFAHDWQHQHFWDEAVHMLKNNTTAVFKRVPTVELAAHEPGDSIDAKPRNKFTRDGSSY